MFRVMNRKIREFSLGFEWVLFYVYTRIVEERILSKSVSTVTNSISSDSFTEFITTRSVIDALMSMEHLFVAIKLAQVSMIPHQGHYI